MSKHQTQQNCHDPDEMQQPSPQETSISHQHTHLKLSLLADQQSAISLPADL